MANKFIGNVVELKKQPYSEEALSMLQRITAQVRPVMQSRSWRVATLCEFYPRDAALQGQNINRGQEVRLCLRNPHDPYQFLRFNDVLGTMLHELAHIEHGAHDEKFYKLLDELKSETEGLMAQGYTGDGFFSIGLRVGLGHSHNAPWHQLREKTLRAVEARQKKQMFAAGPPRALAGGAGRSSGSDWRRLETTHSPAQMAAIALERRMRDERRCGGPVNIDTTPRRKQSTRPGGEGDGCIVISDSESGPDQASDAVVLDD